MRRFNKKDTKRKNRESLSPLDDGSISSYIIKFILGIFMGACIEIIGLIFIFSFIRLGIDEASSSSNVINYIIIGLITFPILNGLLCMVRFDIVKAIFEYAKESCQNINSN
jgi:hypothetical protein